MIGNEIHAFSMGFRDETDLRTAFTETPRLQLPRYNVDVCFTMDTRSLSPYIPFLLVDGDLRRGEWSQDALGDGGCMDERPDTHIWKEKVSLVISA